MKTEVTKYFDQISLIIFHWQWKRGKDEEYLKGKRTMRKRERQMRERGQWENRETQEKDQIYAQIWS